MPMVQGKDIELRMRNTPGAWPVEIKQTTLQLAAQKPENLDSPLRLSQVYKPGALVPSEVTIRFAIDPNGMVMKPQIKHFSAQSGREGIALLATLNALNMWHFKPPVHNGTSTGYCCVQLMMENVNWTGATIETNYFRIPDEWN
jgi:hypothetical protein